MLKNLPNTNQMHLPPIRTLWGLPKAHRIKNDCITRLLGPAHSDTYGPCYSLFWFQVPPPPPSVQPPGFLSDPKVFVLPITELSHMLFPLSLSPVFALLSHMDSGPCSYGKGGFPGLIAPLKAVIT